MSGAFVLELDDVGVRGWDPHFLRGGPRRFAKLQGRQPVAVRGGAHLG